MDLQTLPGLFLTTLLVMFRFKLTKKLHNDSFSKTTGKVLPYSSKPTQCRLVKTPASKLSGKGGTAEQKAVSNMFTGILASSCPCYNALGFS